MLKTVWLLRLRTPNNIMEHEYWRLGQTSEDYATPAADFQSQIRTLCLDAINIRNTGEEHLEAVLSGGVDSGLIAAVASHRYSASNPIKIFSIGYHEQDFDDSLLQNLMLQHYPLRQYKAIKTEDKVIP